MSDEGATADRRALVAATACAAASIRLPGDVVSATDATGVEGVVVGHATGAPSVAAPRHAWFRPPARPAGHPPPPPRRPPPPPPSNRGMRPRRRP